MPLREDELPEGYRRTAGDGDISLHGSVPFILDVKHDLQRIGVRVPLEFVHHAVLGRLTMLRLRFNAENLHAVQEGSPDANAKRSAVQPVSSTSNRQLRRIVVMEKPFIANPDAAVGGRGFAVAQPARTQQSQARRDYDQRPDKPANPLRSPLRLLKFRIDF
jgi:hypothetical protein